STRPNPAQAGTFVRDAFPGNQIPASLLKPGMVYFARTVLPKPEPTGIADRNAINRTTNSNQAHSVNARIDHKFSDYDAVWLRYSGNYAPGNVAASLPSIVRNSDNRAHNLAANWVHTFGPSTVLQAQFGRVSQWNGSTDKYQSLPSDFISKVGYSSNVITPYLDGNTYLPGFNPANFFSSSEQWNVSRNGDSWHFKGGLKKLIGTYTIIHDGEKN